MKSVQAAGPSRPALDRRECLCRWKRLGKSLTSCMTSVPRCCSILLSLQYLCIHYLPTGLNAVLQVELHSSELADQTVSDAAVREQLSPALDQTAGMDNPNIALLWTLQRGHNTFRPDGASESCYDRLCRERKEAILSSLTIAKFSNESMQDAVKLQQEFEVARGCSASLFLVLFVWQCHARFCHVKSAAQGPSTCRQLQ